MNRTRLEVIAIFCGGEPKTEATMAAPVARMAPALTNNQCKGGFKHLNGWAIGLTLILLHTMSSKYSYSTTS